MLLFTENGHYFTVVEDFTDPEFLWVRSQDKASIRDVIGHLKNRFPIPANGVTFELINEPTWDYQFRVKLTRPLWAEYLGHVTDTLCANKLKPAVAAARGYDHPIAKAVEQVFYYMSENRPDGSKPAWLEGTFKR